MNKENNIENNEEINEGPVFTDVDQMRKSAFLTPKEIGMLLRISTTTLYSLLLSEECPFPVLRLSSQLVRIPTRQFFLWYDGLSS